MMKKILLALGLLSYAPGLCAMDAFWGGFKSFTGAIASAVTPKKGRKQLDDAQRAQYVQDIQDSSSTVDEFFHELATHEEWLDLPFDTVVKLPDDVVIGQLFFQLDEQDQAKKDLKQKYFMRGGYDQLIQRVQGLIQGGDFKALVQGFKNYPLLAAVANPFQFTMKPVGNVGCYVETWSLVDADCKELKALVGARWDECYKEAYNADLKKAYPKAQFDAQRLENLQRDLSAAADADTCLDALVKACQADAGYFDIPLLHTLAINRGAGIVTLETLIHHAMQQNNAQAIFFLARYLQNELQDLITKAQGSDAGRAELAQKAQQLPKVFKTFDLFKGQLGAEIDKLCATGDADALAIKAIYGDALWESQKTWPDDEAVLKKRKPNLNEVRAIMVKRKGSSRIKPYYDQFLQRLQGTIVNKVSDAVRTNDLTELKNVRQEVEAIMNDGFDFGKGKHTAQLISELDQAIVPLEEKAKVQACCENNWELTDDAAALLKAHATDPEFDKFIQAIKADLPTQVDDALANATAAPALERLEKWMTALTDAGIDLGGATTVADYQIKLGEKKATFAPPVPQPQPQSQPTQNQAGWSTRTKVALGIGAGIVCYWLANKYQQHKQQKPQATTAKA